MHSGPHLSKKNCADIAILSFYEPGHAQLATDSGLSGSLFCQVKSRPPSLKTDFLKKRKPVLTRSTWGRPLSSLNAPHVYHASDA